MITKLCIQADDPEAIRAVAAHLTKLAGGLLAGEIKLDEYRQDFDFLDVDDGRFRRHVPTGRTTHTFVAVHPVEQP